MMIEHKLGHIGESNAYVMPDDLLRGKRIMYFGGNMDKVTAVYNDEPERITDNRVYQFPSYIDYLITNTERIVSHETIHLLIYDLTKSIDTTRDYDNIDGNNEITPFTPPNL